jgi:NADPH2:quinone reductase
MKAILCTRYGGPDDLAFSDLPDPSPGPGEVVVTVKAAALNFFDTLIIAGKYQVKPPFPFSPASEFAGIIESVGAGVTAFATGDRVLGYGGYGAAREKVLISQQRVVKIPGTLDFDRAAGLTVIYGTTLHALQDRAHLKAGETLAVLGASGGTGLAASEIGKLMGARVIACASSDDKLDFARERGADDGINYAKDDIKEALRRVTGGKGVDVIYDPVGGPYAEPALRSIAWKGRFLVIGFAAGEIPKIPLNLALLKGCDIVGVFWGAFIEREPQGHQANMAQLVTWAAEGKLSAHVHDVYPLAKTADALKVLANRQAMGKVILRPQGLNPP